MKIEVTIDSNANIKSKKVGYMEVDEGEWNFCSDDEKNEQVLNFIWNDMGAYWSYKEV